MNKEIKHDYNCSNHFCKRKAEYNLQTQWHLYEITNEGNFEEKKNWEGAENEFLCKECAETENII